MSDLNERLAQADPFAGTTYVHRDLDALISRVSAAPATPRRRLWRGFQLKVAGSLVASALVTASAIAALDGAGSSLPLLAIAGTNFHSPSATRPLAFNRSTGAGAMAVYEQFDFAAAPSLSSATFAPNQATSSVRLVTPDAETEAARVAGVFGIVGALQLASGGDKNFQIGEPDGASLTYNNTGVPQWTFTDFPSGNTTGSLPSHAVVEADAAKYLSRLNYGFSVSAPTFSTTSTSIDQGSAATEESEESITYVVVVHGLPTDQSVDFTVDPNNQLIEASGPAFDVGSSAAYPLQSPTDGVSQLNAAEAVKFEHVTTSNAPPVVPITLTDATISLQAFTLSDGSLWLLPVYDYRGGPTGVVNTSTSETWRELAVDPTYVASDAASPAGNHGVINF